MHMHILLWVRNGNIFGIKAILNSTRGSTITNITGSETRRVDMVFGIGYDDDIAKAETVLLDILQQHPLVHKEPEHRTGGKSVSSSQKQNY
jgi:small-conductance mechanosensitive channel